MKNMIFVWIIVAILAIIFLFVVLRRVGLIKSSTQRQTAKKVDKETGDTKIIQTTVNDTKYFKPTFYKSFPVSRQMSPVEADKVAKKIEDAWGLINDDEEQVYAAFRGLTDQVQVSQVAESYQKLFGDDLAGTLIGRLSKSELKMVYDITDTL